MANRTIEPRKLVAELVVVVVGILLALAIDQAVTRRAERALEREYLSALQEDFRGTVEWLDGYGNEVNRRKEVVLLETQSVLEGVEGATIDSVRFVYTLGFAGFHPVLPVPRATFDDLTGTGNLRVIRDAGLRRELVDFYAWVELFSVHEAAMVERGSEARSLTSAILGPRLTSQISNLGWNAGSDAWPPLDALAVPPSVREAAAGSRAVAAARRSPDLSRVLSGLVADTYLQRQQFKLVGERARAVLRSLQTLAVAS